MAELMKSIENADQHKEALQQLSVETRAQRLTQAERSYGSEMRALEESAAGKFQSQKFEGADKVQYRIDATDLDRAEYLTRELTLLRDLSKEQVQVTNNTQVDLDRLSGAMCGYDPPVESSSIQSSDVVDDVAKGIAKPATIETATIETHKVKEKETLYKIAKMHNTSVDTLMQLNSDKIENPDLIKVGWKIKVPGKEDPTKQLNNMPSPELVTALDTGAKELAGDTPDTVVLDTAKANLEKSLAKDKLFSEYLDALYKTSNVFDFSHGDPFSFNPTNGVSIAALDEKGQENFINLPGALEDFAKAGFSSGEELVSWLNEKAKEMQSPVPALEEESDEAESRDNVDVSKKIVKLKNIYEKLVRQYDLEKSTDDPKVASAKQDSLIFLKKTIDLLSIIDDPQKNDADKSKARQELKIIEQKFTEFVSKTTANFGDLIKGLREDPAVGLVVSATVPAPVESSALVATADPTATSGAQAVDSAHLAPAEAQGHQTAGEPKEKVNAAAGEEANKLQEAGLKTAVKAAVGTLDPGLQIDFENTWGKTFEVDGKDVTFDVMKASGGENAETLKNKVLLNEEAWKKLGFNSAEEAAAKLNEMYKDPSNRKDLTTVHWIDPRLRAQTEESKAGAAPAPAPQATVTPSGGTVEVKAEAEKNIEAARKTFFEQLNNDVKSINCTIKWDEPNRFFISKPGHLCVNAISNTDRTNQMIVFGEKIISSLPKLGFKTSNELVSWLNSQAPAKEAPKSASAADSTAASGARVVEPAPISAPQAAVTPSGVVVEAKAEGLSAEQIEKNKTEFIQSLASKIGSENNIKWRSFRVSGEDIVVSQINKKSSIESAISVGKISAFAKLGFKSAQEMINWLNTKGLEAKAAVPAAATKDAPKPVKENETKAIETFRDQAYAEILQTLKDNNMAIKKLDTGDVFSVTADGEIISVHLLTKDKDNKEGVSVISGFNLKKLGFEDAGLFAAWLNKKQSSVKK